MDTYKHKTMASIMSLEKIEIIRSQEFMLSKARLKFLKIMIILGPKTAILGPQFCRILVLGPHFWWSGARAPRAPLGMPLHPTQHHHANNHLPHHNPTPGDKVEHECIFHGLSHIVYSFGRQ